MEIENPESVKKAVQNGLGIARNHLESILSSKLRSSVTAEFLLQVRIADHVLQLIEARWCFLDRHRYRIEMHLFR